MTVLEQHGEKKEFSSSTLDLVSAGIDVRREEGNCRAAWDGLKLKRLSLQFSFHCSLFQIAPGHQETGKTTAEHKSSSLVVVTSLTNSIQLLTPLADLP